MFHREGSFGNKRVRKAVIFLFWILIWYLLALFVDNSILLSTPWEVTKRLAELAVELVFLQIIGISLLRIGCGFLLGFVVALVLAGVSLRYPLAEEVLHPVMSLTKTIPVASFVVLLLIWWGSSTLAVAICFLVVLPNIYINTLEGLKAVDVRLLEMAKVFRVSGGKRFLFIYRPTLRPFLMGGMKLALGMCWKSGVAAEVIGTPSYSIGGQLYLSKVHLDTAGVLAWTVVIIVLSLCFEKVILRLTEVFFAWKPSSEKWAGRRAAASHRRNGESHDKAKCGTDTLRLELRRIRKTYGALTVLSDMSAIYEAGNIYYLTSPSGRGKTTLLRLLCGLEKQDGGAIDRPEKFSMVFQEDRLCEEDTAVQNVAMVIGDKSRATKALQKLLEAEAISKPCNQLSGGMKRRVALVRAMEADSDVVLLDEPFTGMDAQTKQVAEEYIRETQNGRIVIIATHI